MTFSQTNAVKCEVTLNTPRVRSRCERTHSVCSNANDSFNIFAKVNLYFCFCFCFYIEFYLIFNWLLFRRNIDAIIAFPIIILLYIPLNGIQYKSIFAGYIPLIPRISAFMRIKHTKCHSLFQFNIHSYSYITHCSSLVFMYSETRALN